MTNYKLNIDSQAQTIQGFYVKNRKDFLALRSAIEASYLEGWRPTKKTLSRFMNMDLILSI